MQWASREDPLEGQLKVEGADLAPGRGRTAITVEEWEATKQAGGALPQIANASSAAKPVTLLSHAASEINSEADVTHAEEGHSPETQEYTR